MKSVRIQRLSGSYFPAFGLSTNRYSVSLRIQSKCGKIRTRKTANADTFHTVLAIEMYKIYDDISLTIMSEIFTLKHQNYYNLRNLTDFDVVNVRTVNHTLREKCPHSVVF